MSTLHFPRLSEVAAKVALSKSQVYALEAEGRFPKRIKIGASSRWVEHEVEEWMRARLAARA